MANANIIQNNFSYGEISPTLYGLTDSDLYRGGVKSLINFLQLPYGGVTRRPGTVFMGETKVGADTARIILKQERTKPKVKVLKKHTKLLDQHCLTSIKLTEITMRCVYMN